MIALALSVITIHSVSAQSTGKLTISFDKPAALTGVPFSITQPNGLKVSGSGYYTSESFPVGTSSISLTIPGHQLAADPGYTIVAPNAANFIMSTGQNVNLIFKIMPVSYNATLAVTLLLPMGAPTTVPYTLIWPDGTEDKRTDGFSAIAFPAGQAKVKLNLFGYALKPGDAYTLLDTNTAAFTVLDGQNNKITVEVKKAAEPPAPTPTTTTTGNGKATTPTESTSKTPTTTTKTPEPSKEDGEVLGTKTTRERTAVERTGTFELEIPSAECQFDDNASSSVVKLCALGAIDGKTEKKKNFRGDTAITRAEFTKLMMYVTEDKSALEQKGKDLLARKASPFKDVGSSAWYSKYVAAAKDASVVHGYPDTKTFAPGKSIMLSEALKITLNAASRKNEQVKADLRQARQEVKREFLEEYAHEWYMPYALLADDYGIVQIDSEKHPGDQYSEKLTRQKAADLIYSVIEKASIGAGQ